MALKMRNVTGNLRNCRTAGFFVLHLCHGSTDHGQRLRRTCPNGQALESAPARMSEPPSPPRRAIAALQSSEQAVWIVPALLLTLGLVAGFSWSVALMAKAANQCVPPILQSQSACSAASAEAQVQGRLST